MANGKPIIPSPYPIPRTSLKAAPALSALGIDFYRTISDASVPLPQTILETRRGVPVYDNLPQTVGQSVMPSRYLTPQQRAAQATQRLAQLTQSRGGGSDVMPVTQQQRQRGFFDSLPSLSSPAGQGLTAAATTGLQLSGWQDRPITLGSALGAMGQAGMEAFTAAQEAQRQSKLQEATLALKVAEAMKAEDPKITTAMQNLTAAGYDLNTPEGQQAMRDYLKKPTGTSVTISGDKKMSDEGIKFGFAELKTEMGELRKARAIAPKIDQVVSILDQAIKEGRDITGVVSSVTFPARQALADLGFLDSEDMRNVQDQEVLKAAIKYMIPFMRPVGSGSTSDRDMDTYADALPSLRNSVKGNLIIAKLFRQFNKHNTKRARLMEKFLYTHNGLYDKENNIVFGDYADKELGNIYYTVNSQEEFDRLYDEGKIGDDDVYFDNRDGMGQFVAVSMLEDK